MRMTKKLMNFPLSLVKESTNYYNKAFHAKLFTLFASSESEIFRFAKDHPAHYDFCVSFMKEDEGQWFLDNKQIKKVRDWVLKKAKEHPQVIVKLYTSWKSQWNLYHELTDRIDKTKLERLSDEELYKLFEEFYILYTKVGSIAYITDSFMSSGEEDWLEQLLKKEMHTSSEEIRELTAPIHLSFALEAELELLKIASEIKEFVPFEHLPTSIKSKLKEHEKSFHWLRNNYYNVEYVSAKNFYEEILRLQEKHSIKELLEEKKNELTIAKENRKKVLEEYDSPFLQNTVSIATLFSKWKDVRKSGVYIGMHYFDLFLGEIAKRTRYSKTDLTFTVFDEVKELFLEKKDVSIEIAKRKEQCFFAVTKEGYFIASGKDAEKYFKYSSSDVEGVVELKGVGASLGDARGRVRIVRKTEDMHNFKSGEILVTNQTTPEFVPIMKKAAAIVTEQGGITSHAAIVSRELKVPCIIGTKIATKALKNGQSVHVDAEKGTVRVTR